MMCDANNLCWTSPWKSDRPLLAPVLVTELEAVTGHMLMVSIKYFQVTAKYVSVLLGTRRSLSLSLPLSIFALTRWHGRYATWVFVVEGEER